MKKTISKSIGLTILVLSWCLMYPMGEAMAGIGPFGGTIYSIAIDPADSNTVYAGAWGGGVYKSTDGGGQWADVNNGLTNRIVRSLAIDPADSNTLYAGTDNNIYISYDGGQTWD